MTIRPTSFHGSRQLICTLYVLFSSSVFIAGCSSSRPIDISVREAGSYLPVQGAVVRVSIPYKLKIIPPKGDQGKTGDGDSVRLSAADRSYMRISVESRNCPDHHFYIFKKDCGYWTVPQHIDIHGGYAAGGAPYTLEIKVDLRHKGKKGTWRKKVPGRFCEILEKNAMLTRHDNSSNRQFST